MHDAGAGQWFVANRKTKPTRKEPSGSSRSETPQQPIDVGRDGLPPKSFKKSDNPVYPTSPAASMAPAMLLFGNIRVAFRKNADNRTSTVDAQTIPMLCSVPGCDSPERTILIRSTRRARLLWREDLVGASVVYAKASKPSGSGPRLAVSAKTKLLTLRSCVCEFLPVAWRTLRTFGGSRVVDGDMILSGLSPTFTPGPRRAMIPNRDEIPGEMVAGERTEPTA